MDSNVKRQLYSYLRSKPCRCFVLVAMLSATCVLIYTWNWTDTRFPKNRTTISTNCLNQPSSVNCRQKGCDICHENKSSEDILNLKNGSFNEFKKLKWNAGQETEGNTRVRESDDIRLTTKQHVTLTRFAPRELNNHECTQEFRNRHLMAAEISDRTGNIIFKLASLLATAERTCYTAVRTIGRIDNFDEIFELSNIKMINYAKGAFKIIHEPGAGIYDVTITSQINPAFNWTFGGYRQSFKYFQNYSELIRSSFRFKDHIRADVLKYLNVGPLYQGKEKVCIHVRRGDFLGKWAKKMGFVVSNLEYISRAKIHIKTLLGHGKFDFIVISDNLEWCKKNIKGFGVYYSPFKDVGRDLCLLTQCDHTIISSGTFGWIGAWLNETGIVIYDKSFPKPNTSLANAYDKRDYYPDHWVGL